MLMHRRGGALLRPWTFPLRQMSTGGLEARPYCIMNKAGIRLDTRFA